MCRDVAKKNTFFTEHLPLGDSPISVYFLLELKKVDMRLKKKMKFYKETLKKTQILYRTKEQVAVNSIASVVKTSTSSHSSGKSRISNKNSSTGSRE